MYLDLFAFLDGASPWWWIALALALGAVDMMLLTYYVLWLGLASLSVGLILFAFPALPGTGQVLSFGLLSILYTASGWVWLRRRQARDEHPALNRRSAAMIGRQAIVTGEFAAGVGWVEVDGVRWRARLADGATAAPAGTAMAITDAEGMTLVVAPAA